MTQRGAFAVGQNVYLWKNPTGTYEYIPAFGASGGVSCSATVNSNTVVYRNGNTGSNGSFRGTGGGGSGSITARSKLSSYTVTSHSGAGSSGTSYSGGTGGGGGYAYRDNIDNLHSIGNNGAENGGAGGDSTYSDSGAGAGNPSPSTAISGENGTGGLLIMCANSIYNNSTISSNGSNGGNGKNYTSLYQFYSGSRWWLSVVVV